MSSVSMSHSDIISLCRLCLAKDLASIDIFETGSEIRQLFTKIVACLPVQVMRDDSLPTKICEVCNSKVDDFYNFWSSTAKNQKQLNDWLSTATDEDPKTDQPTIKIEADDTRQDTDYENDYDDGGGDHDDSDYDAPNAKRIKINASDVEEDLKPEVDTILSEDLNGDQTPSTSTSKRKKSKDQKSKESLKNNEEMMSPNQWIKITDDRETKCPVCDKTFSKSRYMRRHLREVHAAGTHIECAFCIKSFKTNRSLLLHQRSCHLGHKVLRVCKFECDYCGKKFSSKVHLTEHIITHTGTPLFTCDICGSNLSSSRGLKRHKMSHENGTISNDWKPKISRDTGDLTEEQWKELCLNKVTQCPICKKEYRTPINMRKHIREVHSRNKKCICDICGKRFSTTNRVTQHKKYTHLGIKKLKHWNFECFHCGMKYKSKLHLTEHMFSHTGIRPHVCHICKNTYASSKGLKRHLKRHAQLTGELPPEDMFKCDVCGKMFIERHGLKKHKDWVHGTKCHVCKICGARIKGSLQKHMLSHTGEKPYCCHICGKSLKGKLKEHMLVHTGERPYGCEICGSTFKDKWYLSVHMRKHSGDKPYQCTICGQSFAARSSFSLHMKKHTGKQNVPRSNFDCQICRQRFESETDLASHFSEHF